LEGSILEAAIFQVSMGWATATFTTQKKLTEQTRKIFFNNSILFIFCSGQ
jgi:hypothetical protein